MPRRYPLNNITGTLSDKQIYRISPKYKFLKFSGLFFAVAKFFVGCSGKFHGHKLTNIADPIETAPSLSMV